MAGDGGWAALALTGPQRECPGDGDGRTWHGLWILGEPALRSRPAGKGCVRPVCDCEVCGFPGASQRSLKAFHRMNMSGGPLFKKMILRVQLVHEYV